MKISTRGRYSLRLMLDLAQHNTGEYISLRDISQRQDISIKYLEQIVGVLSKVGFLKSVRGANGGYRLAKKPSEYTIGSILRTSEGDLAPVACLVDSPNQCPRYGQCATIQFWTGLYDVINNYVDSYTLQDLLDRHMEFASNDFVI